MNLFYKDYALRLERTISYVHDLHITPGRRNHYITFTIYLPGRMTGKRYAGDYQWKLESMQQFHDTKVMLAIIQFLTLAVVENYVDCVIDGIIR